MAETDNDKANPAVRNFTTYQVTTPSKFSFKSSEWTRWIRPFERFRIATELDKKVEAKQVNALIYTLGDVADDIITSFGLSELEMKGYETVRNKFENHFVAKRNVIFERAKFNVRIQNPSKISLPICTVLVNTASLACSKTSSYKTVLLSDLEIKSYLRSYN